MCIPDRATCACSHAGGSWPRTGKRGHGSIHGSVPTEDCEARVHLWACQFQGHCLCECNVMQGLQQQVQDDVCSGLLHLLPSSLAQQVCTTNSSTARDSVQALPSPLRLTDSLDAPPCRIHLAMKSACHISSPTSVSWANTSLMRSSVPTSRPPR